MESYLMAAEVEVIEGWPASEVEMKPLQALRGYDRNSRTHSEDQIAQIAASIEQWGWTVPILVDEGGMIIAGHGRVMAASKMGLDLVPCMVANGWTDEQKRAYVIADNKLAENAGWDEEILQSEMAALKNLDFDLSLTGFGADDLAEILADKTSGLTNPDEAPPAPEEPVTRRGDTWVLGVHRLRCGDSTDAADVASLLNGATPHLMVTDPPYGVEYDPAWRKKTGLGGEGVATGKVQNDDRADWSEAWALFPGDVAYVWHGALHNVTVAKSLAEAGFSVRSQIIWVKTRAPISRGHYHWQHEPAFYAEKGPVEPHWSVEHESNVYAVRVGSTAGWQGSRKETTVWFIEHLKNDTGHGTQKPVECMRRPIVNNSKPGQAIYEPFCGSGTTLIAGEMEGRTVLAMELDPVYVDVIVSRWQKFTGREVVLEENGKSFSEVGRDRCKAER